MQKKAGSLRACLGGEKLWIERFRRNTNQVMPDPFAASELISISTQVFWIFKELNAKLIYG